MTQPDSETTLVTPEVSLPEDAPYRYITELNSTRFNRLGQPIMKAKGDSLAVYNDEGKSNIVRPTVTLISNNLETWRVTSEKAIMSKNEDIEFINDVVAINLLSVPQTIVKSDYLKITKGGELIETDSPVSVTQGPQVLNAVGMEIKLDTVDPVIHLKAEGNFSYDPS